MILKHYTVKCQNTIKDIIHQLKIIDTGIEDLYVNSAYVDRENKITLEIDEKQSEEILTIISK